jgi:hypothetical protein
MLAFLEHSWNHRTRAVDPRRRLGILLLFAFLFTFLPILNGCNAVNTQSPPSGGGGSDTPSPPPLSPAPPPPPPLPPAVGVFTYRNATDRLGLYGKEAILKTSNVRKESFGKLFDFNVDGFVYPQPLYMQGVAIEGKGTHDVIFIATEKNNVYAFDASGSSTDPLWHTTFVDPPAGITPVPSADLQSLNTGPWVGITGTPVIDPESLTLYLVAATKEHGLYVQRLHALDVRNGKAKFAGPVEIKASVPGRGNSNDGKGNVVFNPKWQNQRPALLLANGKVFIAWGSHHTNGEWHGWLIAYDAKTLQQKGVFVTTPDATRGGIWMSGNGPSTDGKGNMWLASGQGDFSADRGGRDYANTVFRFDISGSGLSLQDTFTPANQLRRASVDEDTGVAGPILLPDQSGSHPHLLINITKDGDIYLLDRDNLGGHTPDDRGAAQFIDNICGQSSADGSAAGKGAGYGTPAYWNGRLYCGGANDRLKGFNISNGQIIETPFAVGAPQSELRGAAPVVSANDAADGIVWTVDWKPHHLPAVLHAYDALSLAEIYNSEQNPGRDRLNEGVKWAMAVVAKGRVYVATVDRVSVFGLQ